jgi:ABC-type branched-subunit amino acid transport system ATPase component
VLGLIGGPGVGKSTLLKTIIGLVEAQQGVVELRGVDITDWPVRRRIRAGVAHLFRGGSLVQEFSVLENLELATQPLPAADRSGAVHGVLADFPELASVLKQRLREVPPATQRCIGLASRLLTRPRLLLLDEPCADLDGRAEGKVLEMIAQARSILGLAVILVEKPTGNGVGLMDRACILSQGGVATLTARPVDLSNVAASRRESTRRSIHD